MHEAAIESINNHKSNILVSIVNRSIDNKTPKTTIKLIDFINNQIKHKKLFYSIEIVAAVTIPTTLNYTELCLLPLFTSITWSSNDTINWNDVKEIDALKLGQHNFGTPILMHLSCYDLYENRLDQILDKAMGVKNVLALKGGTFTLSILFAFTYWKPISFRQFYIKSTIKTCHRFGKITY